MIIGNGNANWDDYTGRKVKHAEPTQLLKETWCLLYSEYDFDRANKCTEMMGQACGGFGIKVEDPEYIEVAGNDSKKPNGAGYVSHCKGFPFDKYKFVLVIISDAKNKKMIKSFLDDQGIPS